MVSPGVATAGPAGDSAPALPNHKLSHNAIQRRPNGEQSAFLTSIQMLSKPSRLFGNKGFSITSPCSGHVCGPEIQASS
jgi:hypothetical protein